MSRNPWTAPDPGVIRFGRTLLESGGRIVHDTGCGTGRHAVALATAGLRVVASDVDRNAVVRVRRAWQAQELRGDGVVGSMLAVPVADASFDGVVAFNVLYHATQTDMATAVAEVYRTLKPGGRAYMTLATPEHGSYGRGREIEPHTFAPPNGPLHRFTDRAAAEALLAAFDVETWTRSVTDYINRQGETIRCVHWRIVARKPGMMMQPSKRILQK